MLYLWAFPAMSGFWCISSYICIFLYISDVNHVKNHVKLKCRNMIHFLAVFRHFLDFFPGIVVLQMRVGIRSNTNIRMSHEILQCFRIHTSQCHVRTIGVPADVWRDIESAPDRYRCTASPCG